MNCSTVATVTRGVEMLYCPFKQFLDLKSRFKAASNVVVGPV